MRLLAAALLAATLHGPTPEERMRDIAEKLIRDAEDIRLKAYRDSVGSLAIGIGRDLIQKGISQEEAEILFARDLREAIEDAQVVLGDTWHRLNPARQAVMVDMAFNLGRGGLSKFKQMLAALDVGNYELAALEARNSKWFEQVGRRGARNVSAIRTGVVSA